MLAPDIVYRAPIRPEVDPAAEPVKSALQLEYFTDDLTMLQIRVGKTPGRCSKWTAPSCSTDTAGNARSRSLPATATTAGGRPNRAGAWPLARSLFAANVLPTKSLSLFY